MNVLVDKPELERFVENELASGRFRTPADVVASALALLQQFNSNVVESEEELRKMIAAGIDEADRGLTEPWVAGQIRREVETRFDNSGQR